MNLCIRQSFSFQLLFNMSRILYQLLYHHGGIHGWNDSFLQSVYYIGQQKLSMVYYFQQNMNMPDMA